MSAMSAIPQRLLGRPVRRRNPDLEPPTSMSIYTPPKYTFGRQGHISSFIFLQDSVHIVSGSWDGIMCKWYCKTGQLVGRPWKVEVPVYALALSPDGKTIACGRGDGTVQRWTINGRVMKGIWTGHRKTVRCLSWSPSGHHLASGSGDGILIRNAKSGKVKVSITIYRWMESIAYSPSGDRIALTSGINIFIYDSRTGDLRVGPFRAGGDVIWSLDGSKLYTRSASSADFREFGHVFDSASGTELHRFQHDNYPYSVALSPKHNILAGMGTHMRLWDAETYQLIGQPFDSGLENYEDAPNHHMSFSPDGRYLAYCGYDITLWIVKDSTQELPVPQASSINPPDNMQQEAFPNSPSSSRLDTNLLAQSAVKNDNGCNKPYNSFFTPSKSSPPLPLQKPSAIRRFRVALSPRILHLPTSKGKLRTRSHNEECDGANRPGIVVPGAAERGHGKDKQREEPITHEERSSSHDLSSPADLDSGENRALWKLLSRFRKDGGDAPAKVSSDTSPAVVEVYAKRVPKGHAVLEPNRKKKSAHRVHNVPTVPASVSGSSQGPPSQVDTTHPQISSGGHVGSSSQPIAAHSGQPWQVTSDDSHSDWSIQGPWQKFLDKLCYPCGHWSEEDT